VVVRETGCVSCFGGGGRRGFLGVGRVGRGEIGGEDEERMEIDGLAVVILWERFNKKRVRRVPWYLLG